MITLDVVRPVRGCTGIAYPKRRVTLIGSRTFGRFFEGKISPNNILHTDNLFYYNTPRVHSTMCVLWFRPRQERQFRGCRGNLKGVRSAGRGDSGCIHGVGSFDGGG